MTRNEGRNTKGSLFNQSITSPVASPLSPLSGRYRAAEPCDTTISSPSPKTTDRASQRRNLEFSQFSQTNYFFQRTARISVAELKKQNFINGKEKLINDRIGQNLMHQQQLSSARKEIHKEQNAFQEMKKYKYLMNQQRM